MNNDLIAGMMPLSVDIYRQSAIQDPDTGAIKRVWQLNKTIKCFAKGNISNTSTARGSNTKQGFSQNYINMNEIQVRTEEQLTYRDKITNIRSKDGKPIWYEINSPNNTPTVFEILSLTPITDPFGSVIAWNYIAARSENQDLGEL